MNTITVDGLILEATSINEQIKNGQKTTRDFTGTEIALLRDGQLKRIKPRDENDTNTGEDGTWRVTVDSLNDFDSPSTWFIMDSDGDTANFADFTDGSTSTSTDTLHRVVGRVGEVDTAPESTQENKTVTIGDERFLIVDGQAYLVHE